MEGSERFRGEGGERSPSFRARDGGVGEEEERVEEMRREERKEGWGQEREECGEGL